MCKLFTVPYKTINYCFLFVIKHLIAIQHDLNNYQKLGTTEYLFHQTEHFHRSNYLK